MKDVSHHIRFIQKKIIQDSRKNHSNKNGSIVNNMNAINDYPSPVVNGNQKLRNNRS